LTWGGLSLNTELIFELLGRAKERGAVEKQEGSDPTNYVEDSGGA
jgi:hypothetical protein